jgi:hypothetical protein
MMGKLKAWKLWHDFLGGFGDVISTFSACWGAKADYTDR